MSLTVPAYSDPDRLVPFLPSERADTARAAAEARAAERQQGTAGKEIGMFAEEEPSFWDFLDVINPLQHIPVVNTLYREITGDQIGMGARLAGGALFGGVIGVAAAVVNAAIEQETGKDVGEYALSLFRDDNKSPDANQTMMAQAQPAPVVPSQTQQVAAPAPVATPSAQGPIYLDAIQVDAYVDVDKALAAFVAAKGGSIGSGPMPAADVSAAEIALNAATQRGNGNLPAALGLTSQANGQTAGNKAGNGPTNLMPTSGKVYPAPERRNIDVKPVAPVQVPISSTGSNTTTPVTGHNPAAQATLSLQKAAAAQGIADLDHPMLNANAGNGSENGQDWFTSAWGQALAKYERNQALGEKAAN